MRVTYWPRDEYDCNRASMAIEHGDTEHKHCRSDAEVVAVFVADQARGEQLWHANRRYRCLVGPGGLVRSVEP